MFAREARRGRSHRWLLACSAALAGLATTGCQMDIGGQTLPSPYYLDDDVQYFPAGPETQLPLARQAIEDYKAGQAELNEQVPPLATP